MPGDKPLWVLDELAHAGRENLDPAHAARYDQIEDADAAAELSLLLDRGLGRGSTVIDMGAGTGQFAITAAGAVRRVVAVDVSPVMLEQLRRKVMRLGLDHVQCVHAGFLTYEHDGPPADAVYSRWALHHLPDFWKAVALTRTAAMLRPGGILRLSDVVYGFAPADAESVLGRWMSSMGEEAGDGGWVRADLEEHVRDEHSTFTWLLEPMIEKAGFVIEDAEYSDDRIFARYVCVKAAAGG